MLYRARVVIGNSEAARLSLAPQDGHPACGNSSLPYRYGWGRVPLFAPLYASLIDIFFSLLHFILLFPTPQLPPLPPVSICFCLGLICMRHRSLPSPLPLAASLSPSLSSPFLFVSRFNFFTSGNNNAPHPSCRFKLWRAPLAARPPSLAGVGLSCWRCFACEKN